MRDSLLRSVAIAGIVLATSTAATAQTSTAPVKMDARMRAEVLDSLAAQLDRNYVEADTAKLIVDHLRARAKAKAYDADTQPGAFAEHVTEDLRAINGDLHLSLRFDPDRTSPLAGATGMRRVVGGPAGAPAPQGGASVVPGGAPVIVRSGPGGDGPRPSMPGARERNYGLSRLEILPGNIGYLEVSGFLQGPGMEEALVAALQFLARTDAVIIDVRRNGGGSGQMSHLLFSHFLGPEPVRTINVKSRIEGLSREMTSLAEVPGPRRPDVPLYVLTSRNTGSAAEEFSFVLKNQGRAKIVGDRTAGAGHMVNSFDVPYGFMVGVSITRVSDPRTGLEWEAVGVQPDVAVPSDRALAVAHADALRELAGKASGNQRATLERQAAYVEARDANRTPDPALIARAAGTYDGDRVVKVQNGRLVYARGPSPVEDLVPLADGSFSLRGEAKITFGAGSPAASVTVEQPDGTVRTFPRVKRGD